MSHLAALQSFRTFPLKLFRHVFVKLVCNLRPLGCFFNFRAGFFFSLTGPAEEAPKLEKSLPESLALKMNEDLSFEVQVKGEPKPDVEWSKNGALIKKTDRFEVKAKGSMHQLIVQNVNIEDAGGYSIKVVNKVGTVNAECRVVVQQEPKIARQLEKTEVKLGEDAEFLVNVVGEPKPDVKWFINDELVPENPKFSCKEEKDAISLVIKNCTVEDSGNVKCVAVNSAGEALSEAALNVIEPLVAPVLKGDVDLEHKNKEGEDVTLSIEYTGEATDIKWLVCTSLYLHTF